MKELAIGVFLGVNALLDLLGIPHGNQAPDQKEDSVLVPVQFETEVTETQVGVNQSASSSVTELHSSVQPASPGPVDTAFLYIGSYQGQRLIVESVDPGSIESRKQLKLVGVDGETIVVDFIGDEIKTHEIVLTSQGRIFYSRENSAGVAERYMYVISTGITREVPPCLEC